MKTKHINLIKNVDINVGDFQIINNKPNRSYLFFNDTNNIINIYDINYYFLVTPTIYIIPLKNNFIIIFFCLKVQ